MAFFNLSGTTSYSAQLKGAINNLISAVQALQQIQAVMNNMSGGSAFGPVETAFGLTAAAGANGQSVFNLISAATTNTGAPLINASVTALTQQVG